VEASDLIRPIHLKNRMAVILEPQQWDAWLNDAEPKGDEPVGM
jgi:putative SOS response-associated peptidase YedK